ncbi:MAG: zinc transport system substrate-binding protein [Candidatus Electronema aureum]|uniref:Zinc transport system substrate-binding protein n=1 Tax=Candidatus Electronema aureum TaxID=2005002 RepID=A0A521G2W0_9BACT|nr:MAG: zinc transport system substrate-binding protein [Candidatus Electronema aureum]
MIAKILFTLILTFISAAAWAEPLSVLVSITPQLWLANQIGGELINTRVLLDKGQDPHGMQPTPEQVTALFRSRIYFTVGLEFEHELERKINQPDTGVQVVDTSAEIKKISMTQHKHGHYEQGEAQHGGLDPHVWLDPQNLRQMAAAMAAALKKADPANAAVYERNLQNTDKTLTELHTKIKQQLAPFSGQSFLVFHPAFGYFAHAYSLHQEAVEVEGKSPLPRQLHALIVKAKQEKIKVIFVQPQFDRKNAETIAQAIGGTVVSLDPMAVDVPGNLRYMAEQISAALAPK